MPSKSRDTTRGAVYWKATLFPVAWPITSTMVCGSRPAFAPRTSASMTAIRPTWASMLLTSFITSPCPMDDLRSHGLEDGLGFLDCQGIAADKRLQRSKLRTLLHAANRRVGQVDSSRSELLMHLLHRRGVDSAHADHDIAGCASSIKPPAPTVTSSDCAVVSTIETTLCAREATSAGPDAICAPSAATRSFFSRSISYATSGCPAFRMFAAIGPPIIPRPTNPTVFSLVLLLKVPSHMEPRLVPIAVERHLRRGLGCRFTLTGASVGDYWLQSACTY